MKQRTRKALAVMFGEVPPAELHNVDIASFYPTERYVQKLVLGIEPVQSGTGDPSPDNVRPITGHTGVNVYETGKNMLDKTNVLQDLYINTAQMKISAIGATGASVYCKIKGGETYTVSKMASQRFTIATTASLPTLNTIINDYVSNNTANSLTIHTTGKDNYLVVFCYLSNVDTKTQQEIIDTVQVELGSTATDYEAFVGTTLPISWQSEAGTVYAGYCSIDKDGNVTLTGTHGNHTFTTTSGIYRNSASQYYISNTFDPNIKKPSALEATLLSDKFKPASTSGEVGGCFLNVGGNIRFNTVGSYDTVAEMLADVGSIQFVYPLATPLTYQLTPQQIATLRPGINNVWCDTGPVIELIS